MCEETKNLMPVPPAGLLELRRLGRNLGRYLGDTIRIREVLSECEGLVRSKGWSIGAIAVAPGLELPTYTRLARSLGSHNRNVYISAGIHGDEPATTLAVRALLEQDHWPGSANLWICPCLNPTGFEANRRENHAGTDLNRQYLKPEAREIIAHIDWLERQPAFDLCLCLHEDWESNGFYLYETNPDGKPSFADQIIKSVARVCPIDLSEVIEGRCAHDGVIHGGSDLHSRLQWPEAFYLVTHKTRLCFTLEAPSDFPMEVRISALVEAVKSAIASLCIGSDSARDGERSTSV